MTERVKIETKGGKRVLKRRLQLARVLLLLPLLVECQNPFSSFVMPIAQASTKTRVRAAENPEVAPGCLTSLCPPLCLIAEENEVLATGPHRRHGKPWGRTRGGVGASDPETVGS